jgi:hypothetical protein
MHPVNSKFQSLFQNFHQPFNALCLPLRLCASGVNLIFSQRRKDAKEDKKPFCLNF